MFVQLPQDLDFELTLGRLASERFGRRAEIIYAASDKYMGELWSTMVDASRRRGLVDGQAHVCVLTALWADQVSLVIAQLEKPENIFRKQRLPLIIAVDNVYADELVALRKMLASVYRCAPTFMDVPVPRGSAATLLRNDELARTHKGQLDFLDATAPTLLYIESQLRFMFGPGGSVAQQTAMAAARKKPDRPALAAHAFCRLPQTDDPAWCAYLDEDTALRLRNDVHNMYLNLSPSLTSARRMSELLILTDRLGSYSDATAALLVNGPSAILRQPREHFKNIEMLCVDKLRTPTTAPPLLFPHHFKTR